MFPMLRYIYCILAILALTACGPDAPPSRPPDPPAKDEANLLRQQELAARKRAAEADAAGDKDAAGYNARLAENLAALREKWEKIETAQQAKIDTAEKQARANAATDAEKQRLADDRRRAYWIAGIGMAICAVAAAIGLRFGMGRVAVSIAGTGAIGCAALVAFWESLRWAWLYPVALGVAVLAWISWLIINRRTEAVVAVSSLADASETAAKAMSAKLEKFGVLVDDRAHAVAEKTQAWLTQQRAGLLTTVAKARGKTPKLPPKE